MSSCFSLRFLAMSLSCSFFCSSSLILWCSWVFFRRISWLYVSSYKPKFTSELITSFFFLSTLSCSDCSALFAASFSLRSASLACFPSSVNGAISSVDSEKSTCCVREAWNSACSWLRKFLPQSLQTRLRACSPGCSWGLSLSPPFVDPADLISSRDLS